MFNNNRVLQRFFVAVLVFISFTVINVENLTFAASAEPVKENNQEPCRYPDYSNEYIGKDRFETFNRRMFNFNSKLNKYALRPLHVVWASIMPKYGMDRIQYAYKNIEYPKRLVSSLMQRDFKAAKAETVRFLANSTIGLGGMFDPAKSIFNIEPMEEDIEQGLSKCKVKRGPFLILPILSATTPRALLGRAIETGLDPTTYVAAPVAALVKMGLFINRTSYMQPLSIFLERTYADPYDITKKLYGIENYIKTSNLDRKDVLESEAKALNEVLEKVQAEEPLLVDSKNETILEEKIIEIPGPEINKDVKADIAEENDKDELLNISGETENKNENSDIEKEDKIATNETLKGNAFEDEAILQEAIQSIPELEADIVLDDYNPQSPVVDSMRTALFNLPGVDESIWSELSIWNRSFSKRIRTGAIELTPGRQKYKYRYIMQKEKSAPVAILYPSIGEGIMSSHSVLFAKLFYDAGYSVIIQGSHFHWEFIKSMPEGYTPGLPQNDIEKLQLATAKIIEDLEDKYDTKLGKRTLMGTSFGALATLFMGDLEAKSGKKLGIEKFISINPPVELLYALKSLDKNNDEWNKNPGDLKHRTAVTAAKILNLVKQTDDPDFKIETLPFSDYEGKLITSFLLRQKLSDIIFTIENNKNTDKTALYRKINNTSFYDYANKYLIKDEGKTINDFNNAASLHYVSDYLKNNNDYKIYHTLDDYLANKNQLKKLREYTGKKTVLISNGAHLGFLYREEFINEFKKDIAIKQ